MTVSNTPTLADLKEFLGLEAGDVDDDAILSSSLDAALAAQARVVTYPADAFGDDTFTDDLTTAVFLRAQRYSARRNSPSGIEGILGTGGEFAAARVPPFDVDVQHLEGPYRVIAVS